MTRLMIAEDHQMVAEGLAQLLSSEATCCGIAGTLSETKTLLAELQPDVLLLDIALPDGDGIDALPELRKASRKTRILVLSMYAEAAVIQRAMKAGADGYVLKNCNKEELQEALRIVGEGGNYVCHEAQEMLDLCPNKSAQLTKREMEVLKLIVKGYSTKEIANELCLGFETVHTYQKYLHQKMNCKNTASLVRKAIEQHLV